VPSRTQALSYSAAIWHEDGMKSFIASSKNRADAGRGAGWIFFCYDVSDMSDSLARNRLR